MRNIDFELGFKVDRQKLAEHMNLETDFHSLLETSFGYTGANIKIPVIDDICTLQIQRIEYLGKDWKDSMISFREYLETLSEKEREKKLIKKRYNTFLCFHSGKVIMSSLCAEFAKETYYNFLAIIRKCYDKIEERLDSD